MRIILVRHADPDYKTGQLTEKGRREAKIVGERAKKWVGQIDEIYVSPLQRARDTAAPIEEALGMKAVVLPWLEEFRASVLPEVASNKTLSWDFLPELWTKDPLLYDKDHWTESSIMTPPEGNIGATACLKETADGLEALLASHGVIREGNYYRYGDPDARALEILKKGCVHREITQTPEEVEAIMASWPVHPERETYEKTVVLVCHMAISFVMLGYLLGISFVPLVEGMFIAPTGVTVLNNESVLSLVENRWVKKGDAVGFRAQYIGDVRHLVEAGEPISGRGSFASIFTD